MTASSNFGNGLTFREVKTRAGWGIFLGIVTAGLGLLLMGYPLFTGTVTTIIIGCFLIIAGFLDIVLSLRAHTTGSFAFRLLLGIVYCFGGFLLVFHPLWGVAVLTLVLGVMLLIDAVPTTALAFQMKPRSGWAWLLFDAVVTAILGVLILAHWPASALWALGTLVGAAILIRGITRIALSTGLRTATATLEEIRPRRAA